MKWNEWKMNQTKLVRKKVTYMTGMKMLLTGMMVAAVAVLLPFASHQGYAFDSDSHIEALIPAESIPLDMGTGAGEGVPIFTEPLVQGHDAGYIEALLPAESIPAEVETGAGEGVPMVMEPFKLGHDTGHIEALLPAESAE